MPNCCWRNRGANETYGVALVRGLQPVGGTNILIFGNLGFMDRLLTVLSMIVSD